MKKVPKILGVATISMLLVMLVQGLWHPIPIKNLAGVSSRTVLVRPSVASLADGSWQQQAEKWATRNFGFREPAIRLYNQYVWSCYHRSTNKGVMRGREGYLYERYFVEDHYESRMYKYTGSRDEMLARYETEARRLAKLQAILQECGTHMFVCIEPGKNFLYPEYLPPRDTMTRQPGPWAYPEYLHLFDRYGVNYVDVMGWFAQLKGNVGYELMTPLGTHWSNIAATYAFDSIMRYMQHLGGPAIRPVSLGTPYTDMTREPDADLGQLLNLVRTPRQPQCQYVDVSLGPADSAKRKPSLIALGDSFFWNIVYNYPLDTLFDYCHYWYYFNSIFFDPEHDNVSQVDLLESLAEADYVMLGYCTGQIYDLGNGAISRALLQCCYDDEEVDSVRADIAARIMADERWRSRLVAKAEQEGISLEQAILNDANYLIDMQLEEFFPAFAEDGVPAKRSRKLLLLRDKKTCLP